MTAGPIPLPVGATATVRVPATSANLGPGFDALGMALDWTDQSSATVTNRGLTFDLSGPGADTLPRDSSHLVIRTMTAALAELGCYAPGLDFTSHVSIPLARGLGSSSAAIVAGLGLAWALAKPGEALDREWAFTRGYEIEGHGDNIGPAVLGGFTITWPSSQDESKGLPKSRSSAIRKDVRALALVPSFELFTDSARGALPAAVPLVDAVQNIARSALLVHALADDPHLLLEATADRLHQDYRSALSPLSHSVMLTLRERGHAALISGAGPTVLVLHTADTTKDLLHTVSTIEEAARMEARVLSPGVGIQLL